MQRNSKTAVVVANCSRTKIRLLKLWIKSHYFMGQANPVESPNEKDRKKKDVTSDQFFLRAYKANRATLIGG